MEELTHSARWAISHGALTMYKTLAPQIFINDFNSISLLYQNDPDFFERDSLLHPTVLKRAGFQNTACIAGIRKIINGCIISVYTSKATLKSVAFDSLDCGKTSFLPVLRLQHRCCFLCSVFKKACLSAFAFGFAVYALNADQTG